MQVQGTNDVMGYSLIIVMEALMVYILFFLNFLIVWRLYSTMMMLKSVIPLGPEPKHTKLGLFLLNKMTYTSCMFYDHSTVLLYIGKYFT